MQQAKEMHAEQDSPPLAGWCVIYRRSDNSPGMLSVANEMRASILAEAALRTGATSEIIAVCAAEDLYHKLIDFNFR